MIRRIVTPRYTSIGSVTGSLDTIGRRGGTYATIYDEVHGLAVRCKFDEDLLPQVKEAFGRRVIARGVVHYSDETGVSRVTLHELEILPERLPSVAEMYGAFPNFTGGLDSVEYVRRLRDERALPPTLR
jgi:hypothetical protein